MSSPHVRGEETQYKLKGKMRYKIIKMDRSKIRLRELYYYIGNKPYSDENTTKNLREIVNYIYTFECSEGKFVKRNYTDEKGNNKSRLFLHPYGVYAVETTAKGEEWFLPISWHYVRKLVHLKGYLKKMENTRVIEMVSGTSKNYFDRWVKMPIRERLD